MATPAENEAVVRRFWEEVLDPEGGYLEGIDEVWAGDLVWHGPAGLGTVRGKEEFKKIFNLILGGFPDLKVTPEKIITDDNENLVATRYTWRGTHSGAFMGIPPTGRAVTVTGISIYRVADGKIVEEWFQQDLLGLLQQIGAAPMPGG
jgi:steroid delta-isomerase-like uncharacterized protein